MGSMDANPARTYLAAAQAASDPLERVAALAKFVSAKADEVVRIDARIEKQLSSLTENESNLSRLLDALRNQVHITYPIIEELKHLKGVSISPTRDESASIEEFEKVAEARKVDLEQLAVAVEQQIARQGEMALTDLAPIERETRKRCDEITVSLRRLLEERVDGMAQDARLAVKPVLARLEDQRAAVQAQVDSTMDQVEDMMRARATELRFAGDEIVAAIEERLAQRIREIPAGTEQEIISAEQLAGRRLAGLLDSAKENVDSREQELHARITGVSESLLNRLQILEDEVNEKLARLEHHADVMSGWMERRLTQRIDDLIHRSRAATKDEIHRTKVAASPISVEVFIDKTNRRTLSDAA